MTVQDCNEELLHAMAVGEEFLEHHGVKGMKWGQRKDRVTGAARATGSVAKNVGRTTKKVAVKSAKIADNVQFEVRGQTEHTSRKIILGASKEFKSKDLPRINAKPEYANARKLPNRLRHPGDPATKAYRQEAKTAYIRRLEKSANSMTNIQGSRRYTIKEYDPSGRYQRLPKSKYHWMVRSEHINHAAGDSADTIVEVHLDADGFITDITHVADVPAGGDSMAQSAMAPATSSPMTAEADKLKVSKSDHVVTQKVKQDHNTLSDAAFQAKYKVSKSAYRGRVAKTKGDPFAAAKKN